MPASWGSDGNGDHGRSLEQPCPQAGHDRRPAVMHVELSEDVAHVCLDRARGHAESRGDLFIAKPSPQPAENFELPAT